MKSQGRTQPFSSAESLRLVPGYGMAVAASLLALGARFALDPFLGSHLPYVTFFVSVAAVVWYSRALGPSLVAVVLGAIASEWFFATPRHTWQVPTPQAQVSLATYFMVTLAFVGFGQALQKARHRVEITAREREVTLGSIGDAVIVCDAKDRVTYLNTVAEELTGWTQADAAGLPLSKVFHIINEQSRALVEHPSARVLREGVVVGLANHTLLIARDGTERAIDDSAAPIRDPGGNITGVILIFRDVTARRQADTAVARLAAIVESSDDAIISKDLRGIITSWNRAAERLFGYTAQEAVGQPVTMLMPPERIDEEPGILARIRRGEPIDHYETVRRRKDGTLVDVSLTVSPLRDAQGNIIGASKIVRDVTERRLAEAALRMSEERFRAIADNIPQLAWMAEAGTQGQATWFNKVWLDYTGTTLEQNQGSGWQAVHHPDYREAVIRKFEHHVRESLDWEDTFPLRGKDGQYRWFLSRMKVIRDEAGTVTRLFGTNTDITEQRAAQDALRQANELLADRAKHMESLIQERTAELQESLGELEAFSYSVSHDLRAPLRAMAGYAHALRSETSLSAQGQEYLHRIERAAKRLDRLTQEVLTYSRLSRAGIQLNPVDLGNLAHQVLEQYPELAGHVEIRSPLLPVLGNESLLIQVLSNLIVNACKFVAPGTQPKVRLWTEAAENLTEANGPSSVRILVEDNGIGIAPEHHNRLFKIFGRIHPEKKYEGTGIGLAIVKKAAERMGGIAGFDSEPGKGSRFWVQLKAVPV